MIPEDKYIILFDGVCNLCNSAINFVIKRDTNNRFLFAPLQSKSGAELVKKHLIDTATVDSIILIKNNTAYVKSTAALKIAQSLSGLWPLLLLFMIIPPFIRNWVYDYVAKNRYQWYGKKNACMIPTPELRDKFLD